MAPVSRAHGGGGPRPLSGRGVIREVFHPSFFHPPMASSDKPSHLPQMPPPYPAPLVYPYPKKRERKISPKFFRPKFFHGRPREMSVPKCLFFQHLEGLTEVFGRMSTGISGQKLPLWAEFSFLKKHPKLRPWSEFSLPRNSDHGLSFSFPHKYRVWGGLSFGPSFSRTMV